MKPGIEPEFQFGRKASGVAPLSQTLHASLFLEISGQVRTQALPRKTVRATYARTGNHQVTKIDGNGRTWATEYDASRLVARQTDPLTYAVRHEYDATGNRTRTVDARNQATTYQYDAAGNRTQMTDRKGQAHTYAYDQVNRLTQVSAGGQTIAYTYDATGNRLTMVGATGTTSFQYDRLTRITYPDGRLVQATYDQAGNRTSLTSPGGIATTATYDAANRLTQMAQSTLTWTFAYDAAGNRTRLTHPNGTSTDYAYLNNHWLQAITDWS